jgi:hypothetical protein
MNRKDAAIELNAIYNSYELRKNILATTYRKIFRDSRTGNWRLIGFAHDYTV